MSRFRKAVVALFAGASIFTLSSPLIAHAVHDTIVLAAAPQTSQAVQQNISGVVPYAFVGRPYNAQLAVSGGTASRYRWQVAKGSVPLGLSFNPNTGLLSGTPKQVGNWTFTISATENGIVASSTFTVSILSANERVISVNGFSRPVPVVIQKDPVHKDLTTYISLMDLQGAFGTFRIDTYWSGKSLNLVPYPDTFTLTGGTTANNPYLIEMNGRTIGSFPMFVKADGDTFLPLYNVMEALKHVKGLNQTWDGITWSMTSGFAPQTSSGADSNPVWNWTGTWLDDSSAQIPTVDISDVTAGSFDFDFDGGRLTGTAHWSGDTATYTDKPRRFSIVFTRASSTDLTVVVHAGMNNPYFGALGIPEIRGVYQLEPIQAILSVSNNVATLIGRSSLPSGTTLHVQVGKIHWDITAQPGGVIQTSEPISYLDNGPQLIQAEIRGAKGSLVGYWTTTNAVTAVVYHQSIATDVTRFYTPGTPEYALADFAVSDNAVTNAETANAVRYVNPAEFRTTDFYPGKTPWYVIDGIDIYNVENTSETTAVVSARIVTSYGSPQTGGSDGSVSSFMMDTTVNLTKVNGKWLVDVTDLANALYNQ